MKFLFKPNENKIYDALVYPSYIQFKEEQISESNYSEFVQKEHLEICLNEKKALSPYQTKLEAFYYTDLNLVTLFFRFYPIWGYASADDYLAFLENLEAVDLRKAVLLALIEKSWEKSNELESETQVELLIDSNEKIMDWLDTANVSSDAKWQLMKFIKAPNAGLKELRNCLKEISPLFELFYANYSEQIKNYQIDFEDRLSKLEGDALSQITNGLVKDSHMGDSECILIISAVESYSVLIYVSVKGNFTVWGFKFENIMRSILTQNENQLSERVLLFKNLGDRTKYDCLRCIAEGMTSTKKIAEKLGVSSATISYHLNNLLTSKLIELEQKNGRYKHVVNNSFIEQCIEGLKEDLKL